MALVVVSAAATACSEPQGQADGELAPLERSAIGLLSVEEKNDLLLGMERRRIELLASCVQ
jgi:hypothetical protein